MFQPNPGFRGMVTFTCANSIPFTICAIDPPTANISSNAAVTVTVTLRTNCTAGGLPRETPPGLPPGWGATFALAWIAVWAVLVWSRTRQGGKLAPRPAAMRTMGWLVPSLAAALLVVTWAGCTSSSGSSSLAGQSRTPAGKYNIAITGTSAVGTQSLQLIIRVI
jgi:hypothetical protein